MFTRNFFFIILSFWVLYVLSFLSLRLMLFLLAFNLCDDVLINQNIRYWLFFGTMYEIPVLFWYVACVWSEGRGVHICERLLVKILILLLMVYSHQYSSTPHTCKGNQNFILAPMSYLRILLTEINSYCHFMVKLLSKVE